MADEPMSSQTDTICLETRDLWFAYGDNPPALRGISLTIRAGDFVGLVGQNGSGKTTLAKHFNGLLRPTQGQVLLYGQDIRDRPVGELARTVGYVFQNPDHQIFSATTREEIAFGPRNLGLEEAEVQRRTEQAMEHFDLTEYADHQPAVLGFGLRRKVSIAAVYSMRPQILILDEPTAGLDWHCTHDLMERLTALHRQGHTIILITHDMRLIAQYTPRCMVLREGKLLLYDDTRKVFEHCDLLRETHIELPQVCELARELAPIGVRRDALTVPELCDSYADLIARREVTNAGGH